MSKCGKCSKGIYEPRELNIEMDLADEDHTRKLFRTGSDGELKLGNRLGFIETIDDTLKLYRVLMERGSENAKAANISDISFEEKMLVRETVENLKRADLYFMGEEFIDILTDFSDQFANMAYEDIRFSEFTRPCSRVCYIRIDHFTKLIQAEEKVRDTASTPNYGFITQYYEDKTTGVMAVAPLAVPTPIGGYHPDKGIIFPSDMPAERANTHAYVLAEIAGAFELINNPKFVVSQAAGTRAQRRQMKREQDIALEAWHRITWNVDEDTVEVNEGDRGGWRMPLHYTRGHPRRAEPHHKNVFYKDGVPHKWIHGFWSGHPAFGIKKGYHAPKLSKAKIREFAA